MSLLIVAIAACGHPSDKSPRSVSNAATPPADAAGVVAADDCEPASTDDKTSFGVHVVEVTGGPGHPYRFADKAGKILATPFLFDNGPDYWQEGFARIVDASGKMGFLDERGTIVIPPAYDWVYPFCHGVARTARDGQAGYIDRTGAPTTGPAEDSRPLIPERHVD